LLASPHTDCGKCSSRHRILSTALHSTRDSAPRTSLPTHNQVPPLKPRPLLQSPTLMPTMLLTTPIRPKTRFITWSLTHQLMPSPSCSLTCCRSRCLQRPTLQMTTITTHRSATRLHQTHTLAKSTLSTSPKCGLCSPTFGFTFRCGQTLRLAQMALAFSDAHRLESTKSFAFQPTSTCRESDHVGGGECTRHLPLKSNLASDPHSQLIRPHAGQWCAFMSSTRGPSN
jgi:hypothetical protein